MSAPRQHPFKEAATPDPAERFRFRTRFWPVVWMRTFDHDQLISGMQLLARSLTDLVPAIGVSTIVQVGGGEPSRAWFGVRSQNDPMGEELVSALTRTLVPWVGVDASAALDELPPIRAEVGMTFDLSTEDEAQWPVPVGSKLLGVLEQSEGRWQLTVGSGLAVTGVEPRRSTVGDSARGSSDQSETLFDISLSLIGSGSETALVAGLLTMDASTTDDGVQVEAKVADAAEVFELAREGVAPPAGLVNPARAGRLLSIPLRTNGTWPVLGRTPSPAADVADVFRETVPPHVLVVGGSGTGKTTLLHKAAEGAVSQQKSVLLVLDPHTDLVARIAHSLERADEEFLVLDFGADDALRWNLLEPDPGTDPGLWATQAAHAIRNLWPDMPQEYFGPVWYRTIRILLEVLIRDPAGPHSIAQLPPLLARSSDLRTEALERIDDPELTSAVTEEVVPMLTAPDAGNAAVWLTGKVEALIGDPRLSRIVAVQRSEVTLEPLLRGKHTLVSAPVGRLGTEGARLLMSLLFERVWNAAQARGDGGTIDVFIDEWHMIPAYSIPAALAEGRKFGIRLRLANQNAAQVDPRTWDTVVANAGGIVVFRTGARDAVLLDPMFPSVPLSTLSQLPRHWVAVTTGHEDFIAPAPALVDDVDPGALARGHARAVGELRSEPATSPTGTGSTLEYSRTSVGSAPTDDPTSENHDQAPEC